MNWNRVKCAAFGHAWRYLPAPPGYMSGQLGGPRRCDCCGIEWEGLKYPPVPPRPRRQIIRAAKAAAAPVVTNVIRIADFSYYAEDGSLQRVSLRKEGDEAPVLTVNGIAHRLDWLKG